MTGLDRIDRVHELAYQAQGIASLISVASLHRSDVPDDAIPAACWALRGLLKELESAALEGSEVQA